MASIGKRADGRYRARWREHPGGPQKTRQFGRKVDADRFLDTIRGDLARGVYIDRADAKILFRTYAEEWRAGQLQRARCSAHTHTHQVVVGLHNEQTPEVTLERTTTKVAPSGAQRAIAQLRDRHERDHDRAVINQRPKPGGLRRMASLVDERRHHHRVRDERC